MYYIACSGHYIKYNTNLIFKRHIQCSGIIIKKTSIMRKRKLIKWIQFCHWCLYNYNTNLYLFSTNLQLLKALYLEKEEDYKQTIYSTSKYIILWYVEIKLCVICTQQQTYAFPSGGFDIL